MTLSKFVPDPDRLAAKLARLRAAGKTIVFANGCFDLFHVGHVRYLQAAAKEGDVLVVAVNSDGSFRANRGRPPVNPEAERIEIVCAIEGVDHVVRLEEKTADTLIRKLRPHVHAKGTDYSPETVAERETVKSIGARIAIVGDPKDHSSTELINRIRRAR